MKQFFSDRVNRIKPSATIAVSTLAGQLRAQGHDIINLGAGEPDFDTPESIKEAAMRALADGHTKYTAVGGIAPLRQAICDKLARENDLHYTPQQVIVCVGAKHAIFNLMLTVIDSGDEALIPAPYWVSYPDMVSFCGGTPVFINATAAAGYKITAQQIAGAITPKTKLLILNSPSNPSGAVYRIEELREWARVLEQHPQVLIVSDDIYEHIRYESDGPLPHILAAAPSLAERTIVINGVSKCYSMTGWRIGYAAGHDDIIGAMSKVQSQGTSNPTSIAQYAALSALESGTDMIKPMLDAFTRRRNLVTERLGAIDGLSCPRIDGAFYAFPDATAAIARIADKLPSPDDVGLCEYLLKEAQIAAVPGSAFGCPGAFRISFATSDALLQQAFDRLEAALNR